MFYDILDKERQAILPLLGKLPKHFYLAGGTALALQIGHRDSIDFDFFTDEDFDTEVLFQTLKEIFSTHEVLKTHEEKNTLYITINNTIKISFITFKYPLLLPVVEDQYLRLASTKDIACMKLSAITSRFNFKDYVDIFFLFKQFTLQDMLESAQIKFKDIDTNVILKALVYFDDIEIEPIKFTSGNEVDLSEIQRGIAQAVRNL